MRGFSKFITILFICTIIYNIYLIVHLTIVASELKVLFLTFKGIYTETTKALSHLEIKSRINTNLWMKNKLETFNFIFLIANGIFIVNLFIRNYNYYRDKRKVKNKIPFLELQQEEQYNMLSDNFCDNCAKKMNTNFKEEKILLGTPYIIVNCKKCDYEIKIKDSW